MVPRTVANALLVASLGLSLAAPASAQEGPLAAARDLYASARYDEALAMLNGLRPQESANPANLRSIEQYRSLCLLALGRGAEAEAAIAAVVAADPMYLPDRDGGIPARPDCVLRGPATPAARNRAHALFGGEGGIRSQGVSGCRAAVPRAAAAHRRSGHGWTPWRSADPGVGVRRPRDSCDRPAARDKARGQEGRAAANAGRTAAARSSACVQCGG